MRWQLFSTPGPSRLPAQQDVTNTKGPILEESAETMKATIETPSVNRFERILSDEEKYQAAQYPTFEEVPPCMQLFDEFMMCYALVPQLRGFYRQGEFRDCTWKWQDFKYCLSLKSENIEVRRELWIKRRAEWWAKRRVGGSSEDVWDMRTEPLKNFPPVQTDEPVELTFSQPASASI